MSLFSQPVGKVLSSFSLGRVTRAANLGVRRAVDSMTLSTVGTSAAIGAGLTVGRNIVQGRDTFEGVGGGAVMGVAGRAAWRAGYQGFKYNQRVGNLAALAKAGKVRTKDYRTLASHIRSDATRMKGSFFG